MHCLSAALRKGGARRKAIPLAPPAIWPGKRTLPSNWEDRMASAGGKDWSDGDRTTITMAAEKKLDMRATHSIALRRLGPPLPRAGSPAPQDAVQARDGWRPRMDGMEHARLPNLNWIAPGSPGSGAEASRNPCEARRGKWGNRTEQQDAEAGGGTHQPTAARRQAISPFGLVPFLSFSWPPLGFSPSRRAGVRDGGGCCGAAACCGWRLLIVSAAPKGAGERSGEETRGRKAAGLAQLGWAAAEEDGEPGILSFPHHLLPDFQGIIRLQRAEQRQPEICPSGRAAPCLRAESKDAAKWGGTMQQRVRRWRRSTPRLPRSPRFSRWRPHRVAGRGAPPPPDTSRPAMTRAGARLASDDPEPHAPRRGLVSPSVVASVRPRRDVLDCLRPGVCRCNLMCAAAIFACDSTAVYLSPRSCNRDTYAPRVRTSIHVMPRSRRVYFAYLARMIELFSSERRA
nr:unnamed protein product [Digitaria exilis]